MISSYYYHGRQFEDWDFQETELKNINLIVGASGSGKTRYLNTIFNISSSIVHGQPFRPGYWKLTVKTEEYEYLWEYEGLTVDGENQIKKELVKRKRIDSQEVFENLIDRSPDNFVFCGTKLPKLQRDRPGITLLKEEEKIGPLHETFSKVQIRKFHDEGLKDALSLQDVSKELIDLSQSKDGILALWKQQPSLSAKMRGGSVSLNSLQAVDKWLSALVMPLPGLALAGCHRLDRAFARQGLNAVSVDYRMPDSGQARSEPPRRFGRRAGRPPRI